VTPAEFSDILKRRFRASDLDRDRGHSCFGRLTGYTPQTIRHFASGKAAIPVPVIILLTMMEWIDFDHTDLADLLKSDQEAKA